MTTATKRLQELPPPGGYTPIEYLRVPAKKYFKGWQLFTVITVSQICGALVFCKSRKQIYRWQTERNGGNIAIRPLLTAERDRAYLKVCRRNRDEEEDLMKDVPGWEVGTYFGDPIYHTRPKQEWHDIMSNEYFCHCTKWTLSYHHNFFKWW